jgi:hypothetical protein
MTFWRDRKREGMCMGTRYWDGMPDSTRYSYSHWFHFSLCNRFTSWFAIIVLVILFLKETHDFMSPRQVSDLSLDRTSNPKIQVNFNISLLGLRCDYATINVFSQLGNVEHNITKNINRRPLDIQGMRNDKIKTIQSHADSPSIHMYDPSVTESLDELHENGKVSRHVILCVSFNGGLTD